MPPVAAQYLSVLLTHLQQVIEQLPSAIYVCEAPSGVIRLYNQRAAQFWGRAPKLGDTDERFCGAFRLFRADGRVLPHAETPMAEALHGGSAHNEEVVIERPDGSRLPVRVNIAPLRDPDGQIIGAINAFQDITDVKQIESSARLAAIVDSSDDAIISKTLDGIITSWNPAAERLLGWAAQEAIGQHITLIIPQDRLPEEDRVIAQIRKGERIDHFDTVRVTKDRRLIDVSITVSPIRDHTGGIVGASKIARDITERRRLDAARVRLLEREQEARLRAETLNRAKDQLIATVSHELRTPLNSIFGWARIMQATDMDETKRSRAVDAIVRSAAAQTRLVDDLLDFSRIATGRMRLDFKAVNLNAVIEAALEAVRPAIAVKAITLVTALDNSVGTIMGAADRLQQVVWNLVMNAVKFTPNGGRVEVSVGREGGGVSIVVMDTGEGIAPDLLPYVFEPFRQEDSSATRAHGGLGLGLALVRQLVELHGGSVRAESPGKGKGSTFTIALPFASPRPAAKGQAGELSGADRGESRASLQGVRVLVVDDDVEYLDLSAMMLRDSGADVRTAESAFRAYQLIKEWRPNVVLTDLAMPEEDGFMLLGALRTAFAGYRVPIIAVTAFATPESRARALNAGFDLYLTKPIDPVLLTGAVADIAKRAS
jgi:PAS domain S-box-containing protein